MSPSASKNKLLINANKKRNELEGEPLVRQHADPKQLVQTPLRHPGQLGEHDAVRSSAVLREPVAGPSELALVEPLEKVAPELQQLA